MRSTAGTRIVVVGGGFTGAVVACQLARLLPEHAAATIEIVEPRAMLGAGVAYSARDPAHRINVPAARMTVFRDDPAHFQEWLERSGELQTDAAAVWADGSAYPRRAAFGRYVAGLVEQAAAARPGLAIRHRRTRVVDVVPRPAGFSLSLEDGTSLAADVAVLAVSHPPPAVPLALDGLRQAGAQVIADPWQSGALDRVGRDQAVLVVGTGLTMADVLASLEARGHAGPILAVSRRGLLSRGHPDTDAGTHDWFATADPPTTALGLAQEVRRQVARAREIGRPWQAVFDDARRHGGKVWAALPAAEQRRLVRHLRPFWDVHRFRVAPQVEAAIQRLRTAGQFRSMAASLIDARLADGQVVVRLRRRGSMAPVEEGVDAIVVTTGPAHGGALTVNPALAALAAHGLVRPDAAGLGIEVDAASRAVGRTGAARPDLLVAGPLARGRFGELMGLPQVSEHAEMVAAEVAAFVAERAATR